MTTMKLAGAAWSFVGATLPESAAILRALGVQAMDLIAMPGGLLDSAEIERDPHGQARRVSEAGLPVGNLLFFFGDGFDVRPLNSADDGVRAANRETFTRVLQFCTAADIPSVLVLPGVDQEGISHDEAVRLSAAAMNELAALAATENVLLLFEPHIESVLESPSDTLAFLQQNPRAQNRAGLLPLRSAGLSTGRRGPPRSLRRSRPSAAGLPRPATGALG